MKRSSNINPLWRIVAVAQLVLGAATFTGIGTALAADTTPPTSAIAAPAAGQVVSGTVTVTTANADDTAVTKVELWVDGALSATDTTSPYTFSWNSTAVSNGSHSLVTKAYDAAANVGASSAIPVTVTQPAACGVTPDPALGQSTQTITVPSTGTYKAWSRIMVPDTTNNSYYLQLDSTCAINVGDAAAIPANTWTWVDYQNGSSSTKITTSLTSGTHTIKMIGRETNIKVDEVLLVTDQTCVPTGTGTNCAGADTTVPTAPTGLTATAASQSQVNLSWTASTDNAGVTGYKIMRNGTQIATSLGTSYSDTSVAPATTYSYTVVAYDATGNSSAASTASVVTVPDTTAPTASVTAPANGATVSGTVSVTATASDNVAVTKVEFYVDGGLASTDTTSPYSYSLDTTALTNATHTLVAKAYDAAGNIGTSSTVTVTVNNDITAPTAPTGLTATAISPTQVNLSWTASTDNVGVTKYLVQRGGVTIAQPTTTSYSDTTVTSNTTYSYVVLAQDAAGNTSAASSTKTVTTPQPADTTAPTVPTGLTATAVSPTQVNLSWTASTDANGVAGYKIIRGGTQIATSTTTSFGDSTVSPGTAYTYTVSAYDAAGNTSAVSSAANATTPTSDTTPPTVSITAPAANATVSGTTTISANASDNIGVARVDFLVDNVVKSSDTTAPYSYSWSIAGVTAGAHTLKATAYDAAGNSTGASISVTVNTKPADLNNDSSVNIFDLSILLTNWNKTGGPTGDINHDGTVNIFDLSTLLSAWGT